MKDIYKILFYQLYRYSKAQEATVNVNLGFLSAATLFQVLHHTIIAIGLKFLKINFILDKRIFTFLCLMVGFSLNYLIFIKTKKIERIYEFYQNKKYPVWKGNLIFFSYVLMLFTVMFIEAYLYQRLKS